MAESENEQTLVADAVASDRIALQQLLLEYSSEVKRYIAEKTPVGVQCLVEADDVVQQVYIEAFRSIQDCRIRTDGSFVGCFKRIATHRLQDAVKVLMRVKRGGEFRRVNQPSTDQSHCLMGLVELLSAGIHTPSRSVARHEAVQAIQQAIRDLPEDYRQAVQLRLIRTHVPSKDSSTERRKNARDAGPLVSL